MTRERTIELETNPNVELTEAELQEGYHFCPDFDYACIPITEMRDTDTVCPFCGYGQ
jgi:hypothetical protein